MFVNVSVRFGIAEVKWSEASASQRGRVRMDKCRELLLRRYDCQMLRGSLVGLTRRLAIDNRIEPINRTALRARIARSKRIGRIVLTGQTERTALSDRTFDPTVMRFDQNGQKQRDLK